MGDGAMKDSEIGTTAEILAIKEDGDERSGIVNVRLKVLGRQRFLVKQKSTQMDGYVLMF